MAESECHSQGGPIRPTSPPRSAIIAPMTPGAGIHVPMAHGGGNHPSMNMRTGMTGEGRHHMHMDTGIDKIYRKYPCPSLNSPSTVTSMAPGNHSVPMLLGSDTNNPVPMTLGEQIPGEGGEQLDKLYRKYPCPTCFKGFKSKQQLIQHNLVHTGARKYHCNYCDKSFKQLCHLQQHHRIHTGEKPYKCTLGDCDRSFAQLSNLQHHLRNHDDQMKKAANKQHACVICNRSYTNESSLKSHTLKMHVHIKPVLLTDDTSDVANKSRKRKNKQVVGLYSPPTMVPIHRVVGDNDERKGGGGADGMLHKDMSDCKGPDKMSRKTKDSNRQPIVIDLEASGSSGHSPYRGSSYNHRYTPNEDMSHVNSNNNSGSSSNSPGVSLADSHISPSPTSRHEHGGHHQSSMNQQHHQHHHLHHQQQHYADIHEQMRTFPQVLGLAPQGVSFVTTAPAHHHPISEALLSEPPHSSGNDYKLYYSQDNNNAIRSTPMSPLPSVGSISSAMQQNHRPRLTIPNSINHNMNQSLSFTPLRP